MTRSPTTGSGNFCGAGSRRPGRDAERMPRRRGVDGRITRGDLRGGGQPDYLAWVARGAAVATRLAGHATTALRSASRRWDAVTEAARAGLEDAAMAVGTDGQIFRILVALDIEQFGHPERDDQVRMQLRRALFEVVRKALSSGGVHARTWVAWGTGDGLLLLVEPSVDTARVLRALLDRLPDELRSYNRLRIGAATLRTRAVLHIGHIMLDEHGALGEQVVQVFRLLDADPLRDWLRRIPAPVAVAVSQDVYRQVIHQRALGLDPADFQPLSIEVKETRTRAWVYSRGRTWAFPRSLPSSVPAEPPLEDAAEELSTVARRSLAA